MAHPGGRPRIQFDLGQVEALGRIFASAWEMAAFFGCSERTIERQLGNKEGEFWRAYNKGSLGQNLRLRAKLLEVAMRGNGFILWQLAVHRLGYSEYPMPVVNVQRTAVAAGGAPIVIDEATKARLRELAAVIRSEAARPVVAG